MEILAVDHKLLVFTLVLIIIIILVAKMRWEFAVPT